MRVYPRDRFVPSDYKESCSRCGFDFLHSELMKEHTGWWVCRGCFDERSPQEDKRPIMKSGFRRE